MKLEHPIDCEDGSILEQVCPQDCGVYFIFRVPNVQRGIKGKSRSKVDELIIVGVPWKKVNKFCQKYGIRIERKD